MYPCLIVTQNMQLCEQWKEEWEKWVTGVSILIINLWTACLLSDIENTEVVCITSYNHITQRKEVSIFSYFFVVLPLDAS